jgi:cyclic beta-1,2-glucan synthetase
VRRVSVTNNGLRVREIEITSYAELVLAPQAADVAHPAFSKLFVETEFLSDVGALLATRRRHDPSEPEIWVGQLAVVDGETVGAAEIETDRARFLGRCQSARAPIAMIDGRQLSNTVGTVLDPIFALRRRVRIAQGAVARISFWTTAASTRETLLDIVDKHRDATAYTRATTLAWTQAQVQLHHLGTTAGEASLFQRLASHVIYANQTLRPPSDTIIRGAGAQSGLWTLGVSGDLRIVLLRISDADELDVARELLQAHEYWRMKQLAVDLVILNERRSSYVQNLQIPLETLLRTRQMRPRLRGEASPGGVFVLRADPFPRDLDAAGLCRPGRDSGATRRPVRAARPDCRAATANQSREPSGEARFCAKRAAGEGADRISRVFHWTRRVRQGRPGICNRARTGTSDARPMDQCHRQ